MNSNVSFGSFEMKMNAQAKAFALLSDSLYSKPYHAIIRELVSNAVDASILIHKTEEEQHNNPVFVNIPQSTQDVFYVQDSGIGMSLMTVLETFSVYFNSTKEDSVDEIGGYGLGGKTPFIYTNEFTIETTCPEDGVRRTFVFMMPRTENEITTPSYNYLEHLDIPNSDIKGTKVSFALKTLDDIDHFENALTEIIFMDYPISISGKEINYIEVLREKKYKLNRMEFKSIKSKLKDLSDKKQSSMLVKYNCYHNHGLLSHTYLNFGTFFDNSLNFSDKNKNNEDELTIHFFQGGLLYPYILKFKNKSEKSHLLNQFLSIHAIQTAFESINPNYSIWEFVDDILSNKFSIVANSPYNGYLKLDSGRENIRKNEMNENNIWIMIQQYVDENKATYIEQINSLFSNISTNLTNYVILKTILDKFVNNNTLNHIVLFSALDNEELDNMKQIIQNKINEMKQVMLSIKTVSALFRSGKPVDAFHHIAQKHLKEKSISIDVAFKQDAFLSDFLDVLSKDIVLSSWISHNYPNDFLKLYSNKIIAYFSNFVLIECDSKNVSVGINLNKITNNNIRSIVGDIDRGQKISSIYSFLIEKENDSNISAIQISDKRKNIHYESLSQIKQTKKTNVKTVETHIIDLPYLDSKTLEEIMAMSSLERLKYIIVPKSIDISTMCNQLDMMLLDSALNASYRFDKIYQIKRGRVPFFNIIERKLHYFFFHKKSDYKIYQVPNSVFTELQKQSIIPTDLPILSQMIKSVEFEVAQIGYLSETLLSPEFTDKKMEWFDIGFNGVNFNNIIFNNKLSDVFYNQFSYLLMSNNCEIETNMAFQIFILNKYWERLENNIKSIHQAMIDGMHQYTSLDMQVMAKDFVFKNNLNRSCYQLDVESIYYLVSFLNYVFDFFKNNKFQDLKFKKLESLISEFTFNKDSFINDDVNELCDIFMKSFYEDSNKTWTDETINKVNKDMLLAHTLNTLFLNEFVPYYNKPL